MQTSLFLRRSILSFVVCGVSWAGLNQLNPVAIAQIIPEADTLVMSTGDRLEHLEIQGGQTSNDGRNLFHRFHEFNLDAGQTADFLTPAETLNVLTRVNGGSPSAINGLLQVSGSAANLYLLNPAGVVFGAEAQLNVAGDFFATTATGLEFGAGSWSAIATEFSGEVANLTGDPSSFQFAIDDAGSVINAGNLSVLPGNQLGLIGGEVVNTGTLTAEGGTIAMMSVNEAGWVELSAPGNLLALTWNPAEWSEMAGVDATTPIAPSLAELITGGTTQHANQLVLNEDGSVSLTGAVAQIEPIAGTTIASGNIDATGDRGGVVYMLGDRLALLGLNLDASGFYGGGDLFVGGDRQGLGVLPTASFTVIDAASQLRADAIAAGDGGEVIAFASDTARISGDISARGGAFDGDGGLIETSGLRSFQIDTVPNVGAIAGSGGEWLIDPFDLTIVAGSGNVNVNAANPFAPSAESAQLGVDLIIAALNSGDVTVSTEGASGNESGEIVLSAPIAFSGTGGRTLTFRSPGYILLEGAAISSTNALNLEIQAGLAGDGGALLGAISTGGGNLNATATVIENGAIEVLGVIDTAGGSITFKGENITGDGSGVAITNVMTSGGGEITITGVNILGSIDIDLSEGAILSSGGNQHLTGTLDLYGTIDAGTGNLTFTSDRIESDVAITTPRIIGTGALTIEPETQTSFSIGSGLLDLSFSPPVPLDVLPTSTINQIGSDFSSITLGSTNLNDFSIGSSITESFNAPLTLISGGDLTLTRLALNNNPLTIQANTHAFGSNANFDGDVTVTANDIDLSAGEVTINGNLTIRPTDPATSIGLGFDGVSTAAPGDLVLDDVELISHLNLPLAADGTRRTLLIGDPNGTGIITLQSLENARSVTGQDTALAQKDYNLALYGGDIAIEAASSLYSFDSTNPNLPAQSLGLLSNGTITNNSSRVLSNGQWLLSGADIGSASAPVLFDGADVAIASQSGDISLDLGASSRVTSATLAGTTIDGLQSAGNLTLSGVNPVTIADAAALNADGGAIAIAPALTLEGSTTITAQSAIDLSGEISGTGDLTVSGGGSVVLPAIGSSAAPLSSIGITSSDQLQLGGDIFTTNTLALTATTVDVANPVRLDTSTGNGAIELSNAPVTGAGSLTFDAGTGNVTLGNIGRDANPFGELTFEALSELVLTGAIALDQDFSPATVTDIVLSANTVELVVNGNLDLSNATIVGDDAFLATGNTIDFTVEGNTIQLGDLVAIDAAGNNSTITNFNLTASEGVTIGDATTTNGITLTATDNLSTGNLSTGNLSTASTLGTGGTIALTSSTGEITTGDLTSSGSTGGDITVQAEIAMTIGAIDSSGTTGNGGNVLLDPLNDIEVRFVNAEGGRSGTGGNVTINTTGGLFRATDTFTAQDGSNASISSAGGVGNGAIIISHAGGDFSAPIVPFTIGDASQGGTAGTVTTGTSQLAIGESFTGSFAQGAIALVTDDASATTPVTTTPVTTTPVTTTPATATPGTTTLDTTTPATATPGTTTPATTTPATTTTTTSQQPTTQTEATRALQQTNTAQPSLTPNPSLPSLNLGTQIAAIEQHFTREYLNYFSQSSNTLWDYQANDSASAYVTNGGNIEILSLDEMRRQINQADELGGTKTALVYLTFGRRAIGENAMLVCPAPDDFTTDPSIHAPACDPSSNDPLNLSVVTGNDDPMHWRIDDADRETIKTLIDQMRSGIINPRLRRTNIFLNASQALYRLLFEPLTTTLSDREINNLVFIPDSSLRSLPVAALHDGDHFLIEDYSLDIMPSFSLVKPRYASLRNTPVLAMGASEFPDQSDLAAVPIELQSVTENGATGDIFLNEQFTRANLTTQHRATGYPIIHLATHADFLPGTPDESFIQLWNDRLRLPQISDLDWTDPSVQLLVLSACRTAIGDDTAELGFAGLSVQAGVSSALASLWYSNDLSTLALMDSFYYSLKSAPIRAIAVQQAQLALLRGEVFVDRDQLIGLGEDRPLPDALAMNQRFDLSHPYYWSGFTLIGNPW